MSEQDSTLTVVKETQPDEGKTMTWRVLRRDPDTVESVTRWIEQEPISGTGEYGFYPVASDLGEKYGEGDFILIEIDRAYPTVQMKTVVAERHYREAAPDA